MPSEIAEESKQSYQDPSEHDGPEVDSASDTASIASIDPVDHDENRAPERPEHSEIQDDKENVFPVLPKEPITISKVRIGEPYDVLDSTNVWCEAEVTKIDIRNERVFVSYLYWDRRFDEWIHDIPTHICPLHTHTYYDGGRLKLGQRVEVLDETKAWREAFVVDEDEERVKVHYKGFHMKYDEWIGRSEKSRFYPYGRRKYSGRLGPVLWGTRMVASSISSSSVSSGHPVPASLSRNSETLASSSSAPQQSSGSVVRYVDADPRTRKISSLSAQFVQYRLALQRRGYDLVHIQGDGNCLFRSVAHQVYNNEDLHNLVRQKCLDYMEAERAFYSQFIIGGAESFDAYVHIKRQDGCWGDDLEIQSLCELYDRPAEIYAYCPQTGARVLRTFHEGYVGSGSAAGRPVMRLSYYGGGHYDSIIEAVEGAGGGGRPPFLIEQKPGEVEDRRIARAKNRYRVQDAPSTAGEVASSEAESPLEDPLQVALRESRRMRETQDLETCLMLSLEDAVVTSTVGDSKEGDGALLRSAQEESEREFIEAALLSSIQQHEMAGVGVGLENLNGVSSSVGNGTQDLDPVIDVALHTSQREQEDRDLHMALELSRLSEEEALERALAASMAPGAVGGGAAGMMGSGGNLDRQGGMANSASTLWSAGPVVPDEDEDLRRAIAASLEAASSVASCSSSSVNNRASSSHYNPPVFVSDEEMDEELLLAIQESLRK